MNWNWPMGSKGRYREYHAWYRIIWGIFWVVPLYLAYGLLCTVAACAWLDRRAAREWIAR
jgi:hypothetical protein